MDLTAIRAKAKSFIGDSGYDNTALDVIINRIYQRVLPLELSLEALKIEFTVTTTEGEDTYAVDSDSYLTIRSPIYLNGVPGTLYRNKEDFYRAYPKNPLHTITGVDTGTGEFTIAGKYDSLFGAAHTFRVTGSTGNDGMYTITSVSYAADVTTITVATIVDATVDGIIHQQTNAVPLDVLYWNQELIVRPHPDTNYGAYYQLVADSILVPTALSTGSDEPIEVLWGMILAIDSAIDIMTNTDRAEEIQALIGLRTKHMSLISAKEIIDFGDTRAKPSF